MNRYGYESLSELEHRRWERVFDAGGEEAFTHLFGPEEIPAQVDQFLGWFVIRKVMAGQEFLKACGTVTKTLGKWLDLARPGWAVTITLVRVAGEWHIVEVGNVYP
ncbi:MAG: hypothetical protein ACRD0U_16545 [Acidimicrobiales bacterium]